MQDQRLASPASVCFRGVDKEKLVTVFRESRRHRAANTATDDISYGG